MPERADAQCHLACEEGLRPAGSLQEASSGKEELRWDRSEAW